MANTMKNPIPFKENRVKIHLRIIFPSYGLEIINDRLNIDFSVFNYKQGVNKNWRLVASNLFPKHWVSEQGGVWE